MDFDNSEVELFDNGDIQFIDRPSLNFSEDMDHDHIFRLAEFLPITVISDELKQVLEDSKTTGYYIYAPEGFYL